jgi:hypothetical protein
MPTQLEEVGEPIVGDVFDWNKQVTGENNRAIRRRYKMRLVDLPFYTVDVLNPTLYDVKYPAAVITGQSIERIPGNTTDAFLIREFAEVPTTWDDYLDQVVTFPGVEKSSLYTPPDFPFRGSPTSQASQIRRNRAYFLTPQRGIAAFPKFQPKDDEGNVVSIITDDTIPSADEYIAKVLGRQEIVVSSHVQEWRGAIQVRVTDFALAK